MPGTLHSDGFTTATPQREKSLTFLVATIKPCRFSVAAIIVSMIPTVQPDRLI